MPYKVSLISAVDDVTVEGRKIGAINTVFLRQDPEGITRYIGTNTDCVGVREAFLQNFPNILEQSPGKPSMVIGAGGTCRAAIYALSEWFGASCIYLVDRLESEALAVIESFEAAGIRAKLQWVSSERQAEQLQAPKLIVGTVPDFPANEPEEILAGKICDIFLNKSAKGFVLEMCYHPIPHTAFYHRAVKAQWSVVVGTEAMINQGLAQQVLWTEKPFQAFRLDDARRVINEAINLNQLQSQ